MVKQGIRKMHRIMLTRRCAPTVILKELDQRPDSSHHPEARWFFDRGPCKTREGLFEMSFASLLLAISDAVQLLQISTFSADFSATSTSKPAILYCCVNSCARCTVPSAKMHVRGSRPFHDFVNSFSLWHVQQTAFLGGPGSNSAIYGRANCRRGFEPSWGF